eukprot:5274868-Amphidinium_carterae.1
MWQSDEQGDVTAPVASCNAGDWRLRSMLTAARLTLKRKWHMIRRNPSRNARKACTAANAAIVRRPSSMCHR